MLSVSKSLSLTGPTRQDKTNKTPNIGVQFQSYGTFSRASFKKAEASLLNFLTLPLGRGGGGEGELIVKQNKGRGFANVNFATLKTFTMKTCAVVYRTRVQVSRLHESLGLRHLSTVLRPRDSSV